MLRTILLYGVLGGLIVAIPMFTLLALNPGHDNLASSQITGYSLMILALTMIFVGVKRYRDKIKGGVIKFVPAFLVGLGISAVAGLVYVIGWEITQAITNNDFASSYANAMLEEARAKGASAAQIDAMSAEMAEFQRMYSNPLFRLPMTFIEIFPVGLLISLITAALVRNPRFLPARA